MFRAYVSIYGYYLWSSLNLILYAVYCSSPWVCLWIINSQINREENEPPLYGLIWNYIGSFIWNTFHIFGIAISSVSMHFFAIGWFSLSRYWDQCLCFKGIQKRVCWKVGSTTTWILFYWRIAWPFARFSILIKYNTHFISSFTYNITFLLLF